ncbi:polyprenyl synthetase family protein [Lysinibacillus agricola]|uniref:Polyprenyl synthetase family protein n=1 Tax=Lysinibacillus agricola TaxID=2590012 RepID=A0ABX7AVF8_9BACI|nr:MULTISPECIES: polyprenyl synthetase family protein [Lysinibacillus]KOS63232.1 competence protein ComQ [Lysinibacillus sp. FJAT-14222]QQP12199.1 polyprenyl synthetase family protein [Lysinibacillus agricola]
MNTTSQKEIMDCASNWIIESFFNQQLQDTAIEYIQYKFNQPLSFSKLTEIHYNVFRNVHNKKELIEIQTIVELILLSADILDDIQDNDASCNPWSNKTLSCNLNILLGYLFIAFQRIHSIDCSDDVKIFLHNIIYPSLLDAINGQHADLINDLTTEQEYFDMTALKSGSLILLANLLGAGNVCPTTFEKIKEYSYYLGIIAQVRNDVNDVLYTKHKNDMKGKKKTLPILYYLHIQDPRFASIKEYYNKNVSFEELLDSERQTLQLCIDNGGAITYCKVVEQIYLKKFKDCIYSLDIPTKHKHLLLTINV